MNKQRHTLFVASMILLLSAQAFAANDSLLNWGTWADGVAPAAGPAFVAPAPSLPQTQPPQPAVTPPPPPLPVIAQTPVVEPPLPSVEPPVTPVPETHIPTFGDISVNDIMPAGGIPEAPTPPTRQRGGVPSA